MNTNLSFIPIVCYKDIDIGSNQNRKKFEGIDLRCYYDIRLFDQVMGELQKISKKLIKNKSYGMISYFKRGGFTFHRDKNSEKGIDQTHFLLDLIVRENLHSLIIGIGNKNPVFLRQYKHKIFLCNSDAVIGCWEPNIKLGMFYSGNLNYENKKGFSVITTGGFSELFR